MRRTESQTANLEHREQTINYSGPIDQTRSIAEIPCAFKYLERFLSATGACLETFFCLGRPKEHRNACGLCRFRRTAGNAGRTRIRSSCQARRTYAPLSDRPGKLAGIHARAVGTNNLYGTNRTGP